MNVQPAATAPLILLVSSDLMTQSRVSGAATESGLRFVWAANEIAAVEKVAEVKPAMIALDLALYALRPPAGIAPAAAIKRLIQRLRELAPRTPIIAFGPHVHEGLLKMAELAGCQAMARGQFLTCAARIFSELN